VEGKGGECGEEGEGTREIGIGKEVEGKLDKRGGGGRIGGEGGWWTSGGSKWVGVSKKGRDGEGEGEGWGEG